MIDMYTTKRFNEIYTDAATFLADYSSMGIPTTITNNNATLLYYLLLGKYGNNPISNYSESQFKFRLFTLIWQYGPTWEKRVAVQESIRDLTESELREGSRAIYNHAYNPSTTPSTDTTNALTYIDDQNTTNYKKAPIEAYAVLMEVMRTDVTETFLAQFKKLFKKFVAPWADYIYTTEEESESED